MPDKDIIAGILHSAYESGCVGKRSSADRVVAGRVINGHVVGYVAILFLIVDRNLVDFDILFSPMGVEFRVTKGRCWLERSEASALGGFFFEGLEDPVLVYRENGLCHEMFSVGPK